MCAGCRPARAVFFWILILSTTALAMCSGCYFNRAKRPAEPPFPKPEGRIAVRGFQPALLENTTSRMVRNPVTGGTFPASPVPRAIAERMNDYLMERLSQKKGLALVPPSEVMGAYAEALSTNPTGQEIDLLRRTGRRLSAEAVIAGYIYRWRERLGREFAVEAPASVAFDLFLVAVDDGRIIWKGRFDMTQRSLSENILDMGTFIQAGGKWLTAEQLALLGLERLLSRPDKGKDARSENAL